MRRVHVCWYNRPRKFDNGVVWFHVSIRVPENRKARRDIGMRTRWINIFGMWFSRRWPFLTFSFPWSRNLRHSAAGPPSDPPPWAYEDEVSA